MNTFESLSDAELVAMLRKDEISAFIEIYNRYWDKLFQTAYKRIRHTETCEEIVQDIFTLFWTKRNELVLSVGLSNYLFTATKNQVIDYYRKLAIRNEFKKYPATINYDNSNEQMVLLRDLQKHIEDSINQLPNKCQLVYRMSRIENKSNKEIANSLSISEKTVEGHLSKATKQLRNSLSSDFLLLLLLFLK